jgi:hypothetical protein
MSVMMPIYRRAPGEGGDPVPPQQAGGGQVAQPGGAGGSGPIAGPSEGGGPLQTAYVGQPTINPIYANNGMATDPRYGIAQVLRGFAPQSAAATSNLNNTLAAMGISGGGAVDSQTALQGQLAASLAPQLAQTYGHYADNSLQQTLANAGWGNQAAGQNAANYLQGSEFNAGAYNSMQMQLAQMLEQEYGLQAGSLTNLISQGLAGQTGVNQGALGNAGSLAGQQAQNFPVYRAPDMSGLGTALGNAAGTMLPQAPPVPISGGGAPGTY